jgi:hypothetical protein
MGLDCERASQEGRGVVGSRCGVWGSWCGGGAGPWNAVVVKMKQMYCVVVVLTSTKHCVSSNVHADRTGGMPFGC